MVLRLSLNVFCRVLDAGDADAESAVAFLPLGLLYFSPAGTVENSPPFQRWKTKFGKPQSPGRAKEVRRSNGVIPKRPLV